MPTLAETQAAISGHLTEIASLFKNPKITIVIRAPDLLDGDMILTDDDLTAATRAIERLQQRETQR